MANLEVGGQVLGVQVLFGTGGVSSYNVAVQMAEFAMTLAWCQSLPRGRKTRGSDSLSGFAHAERLHGPLWTMVLSSRCRA